MIVDKGYIIEDKVILGWLPNKFENMNSTIQDIEDEILYQLLFNHLEYLFGYLYFKDDLFLDELLKRILKRGSWYFTAKELSIYKVGKIDDGYISLLYKPKKIKKKRLDTYLLKLNLMNNNIFTYFCIEDIQNLIFKCIKSKYFVSKIEQLSQNLFNLFYSICKKKFNYSIKELEKYAIYVTDDTRLNIQVSCNYVKLTNGYCYLNATDIGKIKMGKVYAFSIPYIENRIDVDFSDFSFVELPYYTKIKKKEETNIEEEFKDFVYAYCRISRGTLNGNR